MRIKALYKKTRRKIRQKSRERKHKIDRCQRDNCLREKEGSAGKNIRENGTIGETGFSERSWAVRRRGKGSLKEPHQARMEKRWTAVLLEQAQACQGRSAKQPTYVGQKRRRSHNSAPSQKPEGEHAGGNAGKTVPPKVYTF